MESGTEARRDRASDAELTGRSLAGDEEAFMEVICRHEVAIGDYLERRAGREAAQDLLGDVWAALIDSALGACLEGGQGPARFPAIDASQVLGAVDPALGTTHRWRHGHRIGM